MKVINLQAQIITLKQAISVTERSSKDEIKVSALQYLLAELEQIEIEINQVLNT